MAKLSLKLNGAVLKEMALSRPQITIGRAPDNDLVLNSSEVSGHHARIIQDGQSWIIEDLRSTNGTFLQGWKMIQHKFKHGDTTLIGKYVLLYQDHATPDSGSLTLDPEKTMILDAKKQRDLFKTMQAPDEHADRYQKLASVMIMRGKTDRKVYELSGPRMLIGSHRTAAIRLRGWFAPRHAAVITHEAGMYVLKSEGPRVMVNGLPVVGRKELQTGDWFSVAGVVFEFSLKNKA
jgi:predicted type IV restriction endonuclease